MISPQAKKDAAKLLTALNWKDIAEL